MFVCALQKDVYQKVVYLMTLACADSWVSTLDWISHFVTNWPDIKFQHDIEKHQEVLKGVYSYHTNLSLFVAFQTSHNVKHFSSW